MEKWACNTSSQILAERVPAFGAQAVTWPSGLATLQGTAWGSLCLGNSQRVQDCLIWILKGGVLLDPEPHAPTASKELSQSPPAVENVSWPHLTREAVTTPRMCGLVLLKPRGKREELMPPQGTGVSSLCYAQVGDKFIAKA